jgi:H+-transporting ATPase
MKGRQLRKTGDSGAPPRPAPLTGLSSEEARPRLAQYGANAIREQRVSPFFWGPIPWMIETAALLSGVTRRRDDLAIIIFMLLINAGVSFCQEYKADTAIEALKERLAPVARVLRDGQWRHLARMHLPLHPRHL